MALLGNLKGSSQVFQDTEFYNGVATQSLRFDGTRNTTLYRDIAQAGNRKIATYAFWLKFDASDTTQYIFSKGDGGGTQTSIDISIANSQFRVRFYNSDSLIGNVATNRVLRDSSAWYHLVVGIDVTQSTSSDRIKLYVNGEQETSLSASTYPSNTNLVIGDNSAHTRERIGDYQPSYTAGSATGSSAGNRLYGYLCDFHHVDGQQLTPSSFGEFKNGIWIAKDYTGNHGDNGFRLEFKQTGDGQSTASSSTIGADTGVDGSGSATSNHFKDQNFESYDSAIADSPENNFATMNSLINGYGTNLTMTEGNLKASSTVGEYNNTFGTILMQSGKWYWEITSDNFNNYAMYGVAIENAIQTADSTPYGQTGVYAYATHGEVYNETASSSGSYTSFLNQEIIGIAVDLDASPRTFKFYNNNTLQGTTNLSTNFNVDLLPIFVLGGAQNVFVNFGQDSSFAGQKTAQGNTDGNGIGDFYYAPPSGHLALCSANLPEPNIGPHSSTQADDHFNTVLWSGNSSTQAITGLGFQPDWVWGKTRSGAYGHGLYDTSRGISNVLSAESSNAESSYASFSSFDSDGFTLGGNALLNESGKTYVAWNWKANGGTTSSNSDGTTTSTVQANTTAGFSIITYTGNATAGATIGHGLGKAPKWVITKARSGSYSWLVGHDGLASDPWTDAVLLDTTDAVSDSNLFWNDTAPNSSVITLGGAYNPVNGNNVTYVMYAFAEIEGYSKFGSYTGNGNADGTYVYTGFRPAWIMFKRTDSTNHWLMLDNKRNVNNPVHKFLLANATDAEDTSNDQDTDFTSNGFKVRNSNARNNASGGTYIYMAFAEAPFKYALAR